MDWPFFVLCCACQDKVTLSCTTYLLAVLGSEINLADGTECFVARGQTHIQHVVHLIILCRTTSISSE